MERSKFFAASSLIAVLSIPTIANAALVGRLAATEGGTDYQAYYDTEADLTWLADANYALTSGYISTISTEYENGRMSWYQATDWSAGLSVAGVGGWRLPDTIDVGNDGYTYVNNNYYEGVDNGYNITTHSEMSNMFYNVLGNMADYTTSGDLTDCGIYPQAPEFCLSNTGPFSNIQSSFYWSATEAATDPDLAWGFSMGIGVQGFDGKIYSNYAWAVHDGDVAVSAVPVPAAVWLFGSGLLGLVSFARKKK